MYELGTMVYTTERRDFCAFKSSYTKKSFISVSEIRLGSALALRPVSLCDGQHHR